MFDPQSGAFVPGAPSLLSMDISMPDFLQGQHWDEGNEPSMHEAKMRFAARSNRVTSAGDVQDDGIDPNAGPIGPSGHMMGHFNGPFPPPEEQFNHHQGPMGPSFDGGHFPGPRGPRPPHDFYGPRPPMHRSGLPEGSGYHEEGNWGDQPPPHFQGQFSGPGFHPDHGGPRFDGPPPPHMRGPRPPNFHHGPHDGPPPPWHEGGWEGGEQQ